jgi:hypothetical protein
MTTTLPYWTLCKAVSALEHRSINYAGRMIRTNRSSLARNVLVTGPRKHLVASGEFAPAVLEYIHNLPEPVKPTPRCDCGEPATRKDSAHLDICERCYRLSQHDWHAEANRETRSFLYASRKYLAIAADFVCGNSGMTPRRGGL